MTPAALRPALASRGVPKAAYVDNGSAYVDRWLLRACAKLGVRLVHSKPGRPEGRGKIERFFRTCRDHHDKFFFDGQVYCGDDMAPEVNRRLSADLAMGRRTLPSLAEYVRSFAQFIDDYFNEPMDVLGGRTPAQLWAELTPVGAGLQLRLVSAPFGADYRSDGPRLIPGGGRTRVVATLRGEALGVQPSLVLPFDPKPYGLAANNGQMLAEIAPRSKAAEGIEQLARLISRREGRRIAADQRSGQRLAGGRRGRGSRRAASCACAGAAATATAGRQDQRGGQGQQTSCRGSIHGCLHRGSPVCCLTP